MPFDFHESITVAPRLVRLGESVTVRLASRMTYVPLTLEVTPRYLEQAAAVGEGVRVAWDTSGPVRHGEAVFTPEEPGSYLIRFGDLRRSFAAIDDTYALCLLTVPLASSGYASGNLLDFYHPDVHARHIPADYAVMITDERSVDPAWDVHKTLRAFHRIYGDRVMPVLDDRSLRLLAPQAAAASWAGMAEEEAGPALEALGACWSRLGYGPPGLTGLATPDQGLTRAVPARDIHRSGGPGVAYLDAFHPRSYLAGGETAPGDMARFHTALEAALGSGRRVLPVVLDGDAFEAVEMNRAAIAHLAGLPGKHKLVFCGAEDAIRYGRR